jgi:hypothetical protein
MSWGIATFRLEPGGSDDEHDVRPHASTHRRLWPVVVFPSVSSTTAEFSNLTFIDSAGVRRDRFELRRHQRLGFQSERMNSA